MVTSLDDETKLFEQSKEYLLNSRLNDSVCWKILDQSLMVLHRHRKRGNKTSLSESVEFESEAQYREKLETLKVLLLSEDRFYH